MGIITPGTGGTLKSTSIENMLYEALSLAVTWENDLTKNPTLEKNISLLHDFGTKRLTANFNFRISSEKVASGATSFPVQTQLVSTGYVAGVGGSIVSANIYAAIAEVCGEIQKRDIDQGKNPQALNTVTALSYDSEGGILTGSINMVVDSTTDGTGSVVTRARTYLID